MMAEAKTKPEKKHTVSDSCKNGLHTYIVVDWDTASGRKKAVHMRCQHCLMPLDLVELKNAEWFKK